MRVLIRQPPLPTPVHAHAPPFVNAARYVDLAGGGALIELTELTELTDITERVDLIDRTDLAVRRWGPPTPGG